MTTHISERGLAGYFKARQELEAFDLHTYAQDLKEGRGNRSEVVWEAEIPGFNETVTKRTEVIRAVTEDRIRGHVEELRTRKNGTTFVFRPFDYSFEQINVAPRARELGRIVGKRVRWSPKR